MAIVTLILWIVTAAAGFTLLRAGGAARRAAAPPPAEPSVTEPVLAGSVLARIGAVPMQPDGRPPRGPHAQVSAPPGEHPLLEFSHPTLAVTGVACWLMFTFVHYRPLAWIAFCILLVTMAIGVCWMTINRRAAIRHVSGAWDFPPRLIALHGLAAGLSIALTVLTALSVFH
ncbi:MAG TPA: hypothetical protein VGI58_17340 [Streptosporangiaceae bacterium]